jgi:hypothetical protein
LKNLAQKKSEKKVNTTSTETATTIITAAAATTTTTTAAAIITATTTTTTTTAAAVATINCFFCGSNNANYLDWIAMQSILIFVNKMLMFSSKLFGTARNIQNAEEHK